MSSATYQNTSEVSAGEIFTIFGSGMGPSSGVGFSLEDGRLPTNLAGARVLVNGEAVPLLYVSYWQINAVLPYSLEYPTRILVEVEVGGEAVSVFRTDLIERTSLALFRLGGDDRVAAALNQDGTVNTPSNPARPGSVVTFFGTGGGQTAPPSEAGTVAPLEPRPLAVEIAAEVQRLPAKVLYAGAAPGLVAGVVQVNLEIPKDVQEGIVAVRIGEGRVSNFDDYVTIAVSPE